MMLPIKAHRQVAGEFDPVSHWKPMFAPVTVFPLYVTVLVTPEARVTRKPRSRFSDGLLPAASLVGSCCWRW